MHTFSKRSAVALIAAFLVTFAIAGLAQEQKFKAVPVKTTDDLTISAQDWGIRMGRKSCSSTASRKVICLGSSRCGRNRLRLAGTAL
jgi:hypothetical protein